MYVDVILWILKVKSAELGNQINIFSILQFFSKFSPFLLENNQYRNIKLDLRWSPMIKNILTLWGSHFVKSPNPVS
jgi:hypothetical protein